MKRQYPQLKEADVLRKLQISRVHSVMQYRQITENLTHQNERLMNDLQLLKDKVVKLKEKQKRKLSQIKKDKNSPENVYQSTKVELQKRYRDFDILRKKLARKMGSQPLCIQFKEYINQCHVIDKEIVEIKSQLKDLKRQKKSINKGVKTQARQNSMTMISVDALQDQNRQMKKKIWGARKITDQQQSQVVKVQISLVGNRQKIRKNNQVAMTFNQLKDSRTLDRAQIFREEVQSHRIKTEIIEDRGINRMNSEANKELNRERQILNNKNKLLLRSLKGIQSTKANLLLQMHEIAEKVQQGPKLFTNACSQTDFEAQEDLGKYIESQPLRRQQFGREGTAIFDDRGLLGGDRKTCITGFIVYQSARGLAHIRALYSNGMVTPQIMIPQQMDLSAVERLQLTPGDYIVAFAIKFHLKERRIVAFKAISNENQESEFGPKHTSFNEVNQDQEIFIYDIDTNEWPVCLFGSLVRNGPHWLLTSLGMEIAQQSL